jgi:hypothetical protein
MTTKNPVDNTSISIRNKPYLIEERKRLIFISLAHGFTFADVARVFRVDRSVITNIMKTNMEEYKSFLSKNGS